jgi:predicted O-methyltransferase YrrM
VLLPWRDIQIDGGPPISTSITEAEAARLADLADGKRVLEVGAAFGFSAVTMARRATFVTSVDPHQWLNSYGPMLRNLTAYGVSKQVGIYIASSAEAMPTLVDRGVLFDLIFIDGDHAEAAVEHDVTWARKLLAPGGVLACHDWDEDTCPGVRAALERILGVPPELTDTLAVYTGLA